MEKKKRPESLDGVTIREITGCGKLYVILNHDKDGNLFEVFANMGKGGGCASSQCEALGRAISLGLRSGIDPKAFAEELQGISCHQQTGLGENRVWSCADAIARAIKRRCSSDEYTGKVQEVEQEAVKKSAPKSKKSNSKKQALAVQKASGGCPECGGKIRYEEGCKKCLCGWSECG